MESRMVHHSIRRGIQGQWQCRNLSLGLTTKARACKSAGQERSLGVMLLGVQKSVREWTLTLPRELPLWELESWWTLEFSESNFRGQNSLDWGVPYIIGKLLELKCSKWACMTHLDIWNTNYGQKKGQESNWEFDSWPLKVGNRPDFLACTCHISLESSRQGLQRFFRPHINRRCVKKVMGPQSHKSPKFGDFRTPIWESRDKMKFGCGLHGEAQSIL
jgi:hypothetical protein